MDELKRCCTCKRQLPRSEFNIRRAAFDGLQSRCRTCSRAWYEAHRDGHIVASVRRNAALRAELEAKLAAYFAQHPCVDCGEQDIRCLEFDHRDRSTKSANIAGLLRLVVPWDVIWQEIQKCDVRCANCHRRRTAAQVNSWRHQLVMAQSDRPGSAPSLACGRSWPSSQVSKICIVSKKPKMTSGVISTR
jgi:hypothetical protein